MKMSAWIRFCLIVLCLAMACSMFACRNPEEQTTEKPEQVTTEAPSVEKPTEQPTEKPTETPTTEAPVTETTEAPVTETTEAPVTETTEAPATETTEAPATETTEAPVTETTEAPATETTEAPATETAEEVTNTYLEEETIVIGGIEYVEEAASPYAYNIDSHGGAPGQTIIATADNFTQVVSGLKGWIAIRPGILKYVYAIVVDGVQGEWIDFTKTQLPDGSNTVGYNRSDVITHIGNNFPGFESGIAGTNCGFNFTHTIDLSQYHGKDVSIVYYAVVYKVDGAGDRALDPNGNGIEGAWIHMATAIDVMPEHYGVGGYRDNGDGTHSIKCEGCDEYYITEACNPAFGSGATATDTNTHTGMTCGLCGQTGIEGPHSAPSNYVWDDEKGIYTTYYNDVVWDAEQGKYISVCIACGGQVGDAFGAVHSVELETITMGGVWETVQSNEETYAIITMKAGLQDSKWRATYFKVNPNGLRTGQYLAIRYMIPTEGANPTHFTIVNGGWSVDVPVIADGEWHIVLVQAPGKDASFAIPTGDTRLNFIGIYTGWNEGDQICLDWLKTYDSVEAIKLDLQIGQEACACPAWAIEVVEYAGVEAHSVRCTICGKMDTAAHTPSSTLGVAVEGGYVKVCTVCGGATAEPAMGNYVFDKADLLNGIHSTSLTREETEIGAKFTNPNGGDRNFTLFQNVTGVETGKYVFMKYRAGGAFTNNAFTATDAAAPTGSRNTSFPLINDGQWHFLLVEISLYKAANDGKYYVQHFRMDVEGSEGAWVEIEYIGFTSNVANTVASIKAADAGADDVCECSPALMVASYVNENTHIPTCQLCGKEAAAEAHRGAANGVWNEELGYYVSNVACVVCGEEYNFGSTVYHEAENLTIGQPAWSTSQDKGTDGDTTYAILKSNNDPGWANAYCFLNPTGAVTGQYLVFRYRAPEAITSSSIILRTDANGGQGIALRIPLTIDNDWHIAIVDLAQAGFNSGSVFSNASRFDLTEWHKNQYIQLDWLRIYDSIDRIDAVSQTECSHPSFAQVSTYIDAESHGVKCVACGAILSSEEHVWSSTDCTTVLPTCSCGAEREELGHIAGGADGECCKACRTFLTTMDYSSYFKLFYGAKTMPWSSAGTAQSSWSKTSGYMVYTDNNTDGGFTLFTGNTAETGNWVVIKYKTNTKSLGVEWFTSTVKNGADGKYALGWSSSLVFDTWQYFIVDLSTAIGNSGVVPNGEGKYVLQSLRFDVEGGGAIEVAYIGFASSLADIIAGVKAIENDNVDENYCPHSTFLLGSAEYIDEYTHGAACNLCGDVSTFDHTGATSGVWNEDLGYYASAVNCSICGAENYNVGGAVAREAENMSIKQTAGGWGVNMSVMSEDGVTFAKVWSMDPVGDWTNAPFGLNADNQVTGQYLVFRYRVPEALTSPVLPILTDANGGRAYTVSVPLTVDNQWHVVIVDLSSYGFNSTSVFSSGTRLDLTQWATNEYIYFDWFRMYDSLDRIPEGLVNECSSYVLAPGAVWTVTGDGTATEYANCAVCGEKITRDLSYVSSWDTMYAQDGSSVLTNGTIMGGWTMITGGTLRGEFVISDGENTVTIVCPEITDWNAGVATYKNNMYAYMGEDRGYCRYSLTIEDWSNVEGVDFTGKSITITAYAVSKADPTVKIKTVSARPATVAAATAEPTEVPAE